MKCAIQDLWQSPHCTANCHQHVHSSGPGAIVYKSFAAHRSLITYNISCGTWYEGTAQVFKFWQSWNRIYFCFILLAEPLTDNHEGGEKTGVPGENPWRQASEKPEDSSLKQDSNPHNMIWSQARKADVLTVTPRVDPLTAGRIIEPASPDSEQNVNLTNW